MKRPIVIHPILFALFPVLSLWANNLGEISGIDPLRPLLIYIVVVLVLLVVLGRATGGIQKAGLTVTGLLFLWSSYGHIYDALKAAIPALAPLVRHRYLIPLAGLLVLAWAYWIWRRLAEPGQFTRLANLTSAWLLILPIFFIGRYHLEAQRAKQVVEPATRGSDLSGNFPPQPDIYYIVLDGYGRADVLRDLYQYDNSSFLDELRERGFYVADHATSNYNQTRLSLASSLNMDYIDNLSRRLTEDGLNDHLLSEMTKQSQVRSLLAGQGYQLVAFPTTYGPTDIWDADIYVDFYEVEAPVSDQDVILTGWTLNRFESLLATTTFLRALVDLQALGADRVRDQITDQQYQIHRNVVLHTLTGMGDFAGRDGDFFVFAHAIAPHPPFVFGPNGEQLAPRGAFSFADGSSYGGSTESYLQGYRDQLEYVNKLVLIEIDEILANSNPPPIIILQGDHGPGAYLAWDSAEETILAERMTILNAFHLPGHTDELLYPSITPVNTFRVVMNLYFEGGYQLLEDRSYFSSWDHPFDFVDVTQELQSR